jgi:hypothetical protein
MLKNLGDIFTYLNEKLLDGELDDITDAIEYLEEAQNIIAEADPIEAPILTITLTGNSITVPTDFLRINKVMQNGAPLNSVSLWANTLNLPVSTGDIQIYYYKRPTPLNPASLDQVPDIDSKYWHHMAQYAAKMYFLIDDDEDMRKAFKETFLESVTLLSSKKKTSRETNFKNLW